MFEIVDQLMEFFSSAVPLVALFFCALCYAEYRRDKKILWCLIFCGIALAVSDSISFEIVKPFFARERPCWYLKNVKIIADHCGGSFGLTSNHAANAAAGATILWIYFPRLPKSLILGVVLLIGYSRIYAGVHYPGDILAGYLLGSLLALMLHWLIFAPLGKRLKASKSNFFDGLP